MPHLSREQLGKMIDRIKEETGAKGVAIFVSMDTLPCEEKMKNGKCSGAHIMDSCLEGIDVLNLLGMIRGVAEDILPSRNMPPEGGIPSPF